MTRIFFTAICLLFICFLHAQQKEWKQMDEFHTVMAKSYHPVERGNLQPLKENIDSLVLKAKAWQSSPVPIAYKTKPIKPSLDKLVTECVDVKDAITRNKSDDIIKKQITTAHDTFHEIMEKCEDGN